MAQNTLFDENEFEKKRDEILKMEKDAEWKLAKQFERTEIYRANSGGKDTIKCVRHMIGIPKEDCVKMATDYENRQKYDTTFKEIKVIEDKGDYKICYWYSPFPFPCSDRDYVNCIKVFEDESTNTAIAVGINAVHPDAPEKPKVIRAEIILNAMIFRPEEKDPNSSVFTMIVQNDFKGLIPLFVVNTAIIGTADKMRADMTKYYKDVYLKEKKEKQ